MRKHIGKFRRFILPPGSLLDCVASGAGAGFFSGIPCGMILWLIACLWRPAKHPVRAAVLCASLGGSLALLAVTIDMVKNPDTERMLLLFLRMFAVMAVGAFFGFVVTAIA